MPKKKSKKSKLKEECERLMYKLAKILYGDNCEICGSKFGIVVHHFIPRSKCKALIYTPENWVILCRNCHFDFHMRYNSIIAGKIVEKRGTNWFNKLNELYEKARKMKGYYGIRWLEQQKQFLEEQIKKVRQSQGEIDGL
jgi:5-methylcytosine-specific restriction endonuclease McrA